MIITIGMIKMSRFLHSTHNSWTPSWPHCMLQNLTSSGIIWKSMRMRMQMKLNSSLKPTGKVDLIFRMVYLVTVTWGALATECQRHGYISQWGPKGSFLELASQRVPWLLAYDNDNDKNYEQVHHPKHTQAAWDDWVRPRPTPAHLQWSAWGNKVPWLWWWWWWSWWSL